MKTKRVTYNNVRYEVETSPKVKVKNLDTCGYVRKFKDEIAAMDDETIRMVVNTDVGSPTYEFWSEEEAVSQLQRFKFHWESAEIYNSAGDILDEIQNGKDE